MSSWTAGAVSAAAGVMALLTATLLWTIGKRKWPRFIAVLVLSGSMGLAGSQVGGWLRTGSAFVDSKLSEVIHGFTGGTVAGVLGLICVAIVGFHLHHKNIAGMTLGAAFLAPYTAVSIPGLVGSLFQGTFGIIGSLIAGLIGLAYGVH